MIEEYFLLLYYLYLAGRSAYSGLWWKALYWLGATIITFAVVRGIKR